jgi:hypothetical protein
MTVARRREFIALLGIYQRSRKGRSQPDRRHGLRAGDGPRNELHGSHAATACGQKIAGTAGSAPHVLNLLCAPGVPRHVLRRRRAITAS